MEPKDFTLRESLNDLYNAFSDSLISAFLLTVLNPRAGRIYSHENDFLTSSNKLVERYFRLSSTLASLNTENVSDEARDSLVLIFKSTVARDIEAMKKNIKHFALQVRSAQVLRKLSVENAIIAERERLFNDDIRFLKTLGNITKRLL